MRLIFVYFLFVFSVIHIHAQPIFTEMEEKLAFECDVMMHAYESRFRIQAQDRFIDLFNTALNSEGSFSYPFDSLKWISKLSSDDGRFRIFTWELNINKNETKYFGFLQTSDGKTFPLNDHFKIAEDLLTEEFSAQNWLGTTYFKLMPLDTKDGTCYLLFGKTVWNAIESVKLLDVLFFSKEGKPYFGKPIFQVVHGKETKLFNRILLKYGSDGFCSLNYNPGLEMIVHDHLIPRMSRIDPNYETYVSDGSYTGYTWNGNIWVQEPKLKVDVQEQAPRPKPILDGKNVFGN
ncbi:MAG: hypothetical protein R2774_10520 [Saprospiraceae bacterium]